MRHSNDDEGLRIHPVSTVDLRARRGHAASMFPDGFTTPRLRLRPIAVEDAPAIFLSYAQDREVTRYLIWRPHRTIDDTHAYLASCVAMSPASSRVYALVGRDDGRIVGCLHLRRPAPHRVEFGYLIARPFWGRGLMTEALSVVVDWALAQPGVFRVGAVCDVDNPGSARAMEKAGLTREGTLRRWMLHPNVSDAPRDCFIYGRAK